jgi:hypothetical protein
MVGRSPHGVGLVLLGGAWVLFWLLPAFAREGNQSLPFWYSLLLLAGPLAVALRYYLVARRSSRSRARSTAAAIGVGTAALLAAPVAFFLLIWGLEAFAGN